MLHDTISRWRYILCSLYFLALAAVFPIGSVQSSEYTFPRATYDNATKKTYIIVTPSRYEQNLYDTNVPAAIVERIRIDEQAPRSMGELLSLAPGVFAAEDGALSTGKPVMRGLFGNRVLVLIDGQRLQSSLGGIWGGPEVSLVDPEQIEQVELVYGPASPLYGSDALGGTINLITKKARCASVPYTRAQISSHYVTNGKGNREHFRAEAGTKHAAIGLGLTNRQMNDYHATDEKMQESGYKIKSGIFDATWKPHPDHTFALSVQANRNNDLERPPQHSPVADTVIETKRYDRTKVGLDYSWINVSEALQKLQLRTYYQEDIAGFIFGGNIHPVPGLNITTRSKGRSELQTVGIQGQIDISLHRWHQVIGLDYYYNNSGPNMTVTRSRTRMLGMQRPEQRSSRIAEDGKADSLGLFWHNELTITDKLTLSPGLRYDWYRSRIDFHEDNPGVSRSNSDNELTWSLALAYALTDAIRPYFNVCRGFRAPSLRDLYYQGIVPGGLLSRGNPSLEPETSTTWNIGFKINIPNITGSLTLYRSDIDDMIIGVTKPPQKLGDPPAGIIVKENLGKARLWGTETFFTILFNDRWSAQTQFCYTQGKDMTHRWPLQAVPPARMSQSIRWDGRYQGDHALPIWCELSCTYRFRQNRIARDWDIDRMKTPGVAIWNMYGGCELPEVLSSKKTECFVAVTNITNKRYTEFPLYNGYDLLKLPGRGATIGIKLFF
ncbi:MAG: TonB-dependent receptor [Desulfobacterota bacterium]|nr:TonB-dependent receptor [Thermodesulfobacteriota bacterium]